LDPGQDFTGDFFHLSADISGGTNVTVNRWNLIGAGRFTGGGASHLVFQNTDGTQQIWLMNGTSVASITLLPQPPSSWHVICATGDFNGDGKSDILWQNTDGTPLIWEMNGASVVNTVALAVPPPSWHIIATGDFNGDGQSDI